MYDIYGIVKVEQYSYNKGEYFVSISHVITLMLPKCAKTREPEDEHCVLTVHLIKKQISIYMTLYS